MESNRTAIRAAKEPSFGTAPANPIFKELRRTSDSLSFTPTTEVSNEIDTTRSINDLIRTGEDAGGDMGLEHSIENIDVLMEGLMCANWLRSPEVINGPSWKYGASATRISSVAATSITLAANSVLSGSTLNAAGTAFVAGQLIRLTGFSVTNQMLRVSSSTATSIAVAGANPDASPPSGAKIKVVGFEGVAGDIAATITGGSALTSTTLNFTTLGLRVGQWVKISGEGGAFSFDAAALATYARISAISATRLSFDITQGVFSADTGAGKTIRVYYGDSIANGTQQFTYRIEKQYELESGTRYSYFTGQQPSSFSLNGETRGLLNGTMTFMGSNGTAPLAIRDSGSTTEAISTGSVLDASNSVPMIMEAGTPLAAPNYVSGFSFTMDNGLRAKNAIGSTGAFGMGLGRVNLTGTLTTYFGDETMLLKLKNNTPSGATVAFRDSANAKAEVWDIPRLKYNSGFPEVSGIDTDLTTPLGFQALRDIQNNRTYTMMLSRFDYIV